MQRRRDYTQCNLYVSVSDRITPCNRYIPNPYRRNHFGGMPMAKSRGTGLKDKSEDSETPPGTPIQV